VFTTEVSFDDLLGRGSRLEGRNVHVIKSR